MGRLRLRLDRFRQGSGGGQSTTPPRRPRGSDRLGLEWTPHGKAILTPSRHFHGSAVIAIAHSTRRLDGAAPPTWGENAAHVDVLPPAGIDRTALRPLVRTGVCTHFAPLEVGFTPENASGAARAAESPLWSGRAVSGDRRCALGSAACGTMGTRQCDSHHNQSTPTMVMQPCYRRRMTR